MMGKKEFRDYVCRPFCMFFKTGSKEYLACQAALVIERLVERGQLNPDTLPKQKGPHLWEKRDPFLERVICETCSFMSDDCDYQSSTPPPGAEPCGGYLLLAFLKQKMLVNTADLMTLSEE